MHAQPDHQRPDNREGGDQPIAERSLLSVRQTFTGKHVFVTGVTGFVGKVLLAMIATELRGVRRVTVLVRTNRQYSDARERFDATVALSEPFQEVARRIGNEPLQDWCDDVVDVVAGDITLDRLGMSIEDYTKVTQTDPVDLILHCAGNVNFNPPLDQALAVNTQGVAHKVEFARDAGAPLVHMSTCFVAGERSGPIDEDNDVVGYSPNGRPFDPERELTDAVYLAQEVRKRADAQALECRFYDEARDRLTEKGLDYDNPHRLEDAFRTCKKRWVDDELVREGMERAKQWGWTNTYTYTKSMGEQLTLKRAAELGVPVTIVRPAIVESSQHFPFPGWNEGVNTCAPFVYLMWKGQRNIPANPDNILDIVPVDYVARGTLLAGAAILQKRAKRVYQFCSGDVNPLYMFRAVELTNLAWRGRYDADEKNAMKRLLMRNMDSVLVDRPTFDRISAPAVENVAKAARGLLKAVPKALLGPARPLVKQLDGGLKGLEKASKISDTILTIFGPFVLENNPCFSSRNIRGLADEIVEEERGAFAFDIDALDWRHYWIDVHMAGLYKWVFGELDDRMRPVRKVARAQDLIEVFRTATRAHSERKALSFYSHDKGVDVTYTYGEFWDASLRVAGWLREQGVGLGDRVVLMSRNEPAWPMIYFGILLADAAAVPVDPEMPLAEANRIAKKSEAKLAVVHEKDAIDLDIPTHPVGDVFEADPIEDVEQRDRSDEVASLLFTSGTTGDPKGVMLTHGNFTALLASLHGTFRVKEKDRFLSVLPLFHTFEFSCGLLMPISAGGHIMYLEELEGALLRTALKEFRPNGLIGVPALWDVLHRRIETQVKDRGQAAQMAFTSMLRLSRFLREKYGINMGPMLFSDVHKTMGGRIRHLISGGAALSEPVLDAFEGLGFELLEGYGLTEAAPVLSVRRPGDRKGGGSVGTSLPGVNIKIINADQDGVGEVLAQGDNVMAGYLDNPDATASTVRDGWLHTGDLGKLDQNGRLVLVGRRKELIVTSSGKNVYPDELEPIYADHELIEELCIVGIPDPQGDERVAALIVPVEDAPADYQSTIKNHFTKVSTGMADHQRIRTMKFWRGELPRTATRKVKRAEVREQLIRMLDVSRASRRESGGVPEGREPAWVYAAVAAITDQEAVLISPEQNLTQDLGLGSLQLVELRLLIEEKGGVSLDVKAMEKAETVGELAALAAAGGGIVEEDEGGEDRGLDIPEPVSAMGRRLLGLGQKWVYDTVFSTKVRGREHIPHNEQVLIISNHCSHLDMALVKYALGDYAPKLSTLAASDYFFDTQYKRDFFEPFTHLIPVERTGSLESSLRNAEKALVDGRKVLIFPEGTRSVSGELQDFKHGIGYLQRKSGLSVLPLFLKGTYRAMPKGSAVPTSRRLTAIIGPVVDAAFLLKETEGKNRVQAYGIIAQRLQAAVESLRDGKVYPWLDTGEEKKGGLTALMESIPPLFQPALLDKPLTWYFSIGTTAEGKWTLSAKPEGAEIRPGRPTGGKADCVLKTDEKTFTRIVREGYVPGFAEFADGRVKSNDPTLLMQFKTIFGL